MKIKALLATTLLSTVLLLPAKSFASSTDCPANFLNGIAPDLLRAQTQKGTVAICYDGFSFLYSSISWGPLWSARHLNRAQVDQAREAGRNGNFHTESHLPPGMREQQPKTSDFKNPPGSYWDRGHMTPNADMPTAEMQEQTFTLGNMIPENATNNEVLHAGVENAVRDIARADDDVYAVTGPIFYTKNFQRLNGKALIPTQIFTSFYDAKLKIAGVYLENNEAGMLYASISLDQLKELTGIDVFPNLSPEIKAAVPQLPPPRPSRWATRETDDLQIKLGRPQLVTMEQLLSASKATNLAAGANPTVQPVPEQNRSEPTFKGAAQGIFRYFAR